MPRRLSFLALGVGCSSAAIATARSGTMSKRLTIEQMHIFAERFGGRCISTEYATNSTKLHWECKAGHQWLAVPATVRRGMWCPFCSGNARLTIEAMHHLAREHGGLCLSETYVNTTTALLWQCAAGHQFKVPPKIIRRGHWCPKCGGSYPLNLEEMQALAVRRGGKCLSPEYVNADTKLTWQCAEGHIWPATPMHVKQGQWCKVCSAGFGEGICKVAFESIFGRVFQRVNPPWLVTREGNRLQLDGYCKSLALAFEHQGQQHFSYVAHFHRDDQDYERRTDYDAQKREICGKHGVALICIPEIPRLLKLENVVPFIVGELGRHSIKLPNDFDLRRVDLDKAYATPWNREAMEALQEIARLRGGRCVSSNYGGSNTRLLWECAKGHQWKAVPNSMKSGYWCAVCAGNAKLDLAEMRRMALARGGECLSEQYESVSSKLLWQCALGHRWKAVPASLRIGRWCPVCAGRQRKTLADMQNLATERGGKCLAKSYENTTRKLLWECSQGHRWEARPMGIVQGKWCPVCARKKVGDKLRSDIVAMQSLAASRGGKCCSTQYVDCETKLLWECANGHQWKAIPNSVVRGSWCPMCGRERISTKQRSNIEAMQKLAEQRGGWCLSEHYVESNAPLVWKCSKGHEWEAVPSSIVQGSWCPSCARQLASMKSRLTIGEMTQVAARRGGRCLSERYESAHVNLRWQCGEGHEWNATPHNVQRGTWCPVCARKRVVAS